MLLSCFSTSGRRLRLHPCLSPISALRASKSPYFFDRGEHVALGAGYVRMILTGMVVGVTVVGVIVSLTMHACELMSLFWSKIKLPRL